VLVQDISSYADDKTGTSLVIQKNQHGKYHIQGSPNARVNKLHVLYILYIIRRGKNVKKIEGDPMLHLHTATAIPFIYSFSGNIAALAPISTFMCL
jgi:hypothetical protein